MRGLKKGRSYAGLILGAGFIGAVVMLSAPAHAQVVKLQCLYETGKGGWMITVDYGSRHVWMDNIDFGGNVQPLDTFRGYSAQISSSQIVATSNAGGFHHTLTVNRDTGMATLSTRYPTDSGSWIAGPCQPYAAPAQRF